MLLSLFSGAFFLIKDKGKTKRTAYSLGLRVSIAVVLFATLVYGFLTGQIGPESWFTSHTQKLPNKSKPHPKSANTTTPLQSKIGPHDWIGLLIPL